MLSCNEGFFRLTISLFFSFFCNCKQLNKPQESNGETSQTTEQVILNDKLIKRIQLLKPDERVVNPSVSHFTATPVHV